MDIQRRFMLVDADGSMIVIYAEGMYLEQV